MGLPNETELVKYLTVIREAILHARVLAWQKRSHEEIADLLDAIHNVPEMLIKWESCDEKYLKEKMESYDKKWTKGDGFSLKKSLNKF